MDSHLSNFAPIVLFVYNRPEHTRRTVEALRKNEYASESVLYIFADGPKEDADEPVRRKTSQVRDYIHTISGFKNVIITEQKINIGLDTSVINGVTEVINKFGRCITVEDDIVTHPWFLRFVNECLERYENDKRIWMVGGYNVRMVVPWWYRRDVYLAHRCCSWGWGMWKDRWNSIDWELVGYQDFIHNKRLLKKFCRGGNDMLPMLIEQMKYEVPAWDIRFDYTLMQHDGYVLRPVKSLVINNGLDGTGVHCGVLDSVAVAADQPGEAMYNVHLPKRIMKSIKMEREFKLFSSPEVAYDKLLKEIVRRIFSRIKRFFRKSI